MRRLISLLLTIVMLIPLSMTSCSDPKVANRLEDFYYERSENDIITITGLKKQTATKIYIPDGVDIIGESAFWNNENIIKLDISPSVSVIEEKAFANCATLTWVDFGDVNIIEDYAFANCKKLYYAALPIRLGSIGVYSFSGCKELTSITFPSTISTIGVSALEGCMQLKYVNYRGFDFQWYNVDKGYHWDFETGSYEMTYNYSGSGVIE